VADSAKSDAPDIATPGEAGNAIPVDLFPEAPVSIDLKNPAGWMLHLRSRAVEGLVTKVNELFDPDNGKRSDLTNVILQSFNPAIIASMAAGHTAEEALGYEPDQLAQDAYDALQAGATRQPRSGGGGSSKGGSSSANKIDTEDGVDKLPEWFVKKLNREDGCPECDGTKFWDNRQSKRSEKDPDFRCANQDCDAGKGYPFAVWEPKEDDRRGRSRRSSRTD
jgi:hypothetical protein